jgi:hypothetical protein
MVNGQQMAKRGSLALRHYMQTKSSWSFQVAMLALKSSVI